MRDDSEVIASYIPLVSFLGEVVGRNTEVVLHDLADIDASVVAIVIAVARARRRDLALAVSSRSWRRRPAGPTGFQASTHPDSPRG